MRIVCFVCVNCLFCLSDILVVVSSERKKPLSLSPCKIDNNNMVFHVEISLSLSFSSSTTFIYDGMKAN